MNRDAREQLLPVRVARERQPVGAAGLAIDLARRVASITTVGTVQPAQQATVTFPVSGPGSVGMETCFVNLVEPGDKVIVCSAGKFGERWVEMAAAFGLDAVQVEAVVYGGTGR